MTQFHEGQEVEVATLVAGYALKQDEAGRWRKAKIVARLVNDRTTNLQRYEVQFPNGSRAIFDAEHIRAIQQDRPFWEEVLPHYETRD